LIREKAAVRGKDELNIQRRLLPMVKIEKEYRFAGPDGQGRAARAVRR
jgi:predicted dithiol-disulfide oxidoreductase (DUF899 family)